MCPQAIPPLTISHFILVTAAIELWSTFAKPEHWPISYPEGNATGPFINYQMLDQALVFKHSNC
jgi:hypothetical protein